MNLDATRQQLADRLRQTIQTGEIKLASGRTTDFYFDGRLVTLDPAGLKLVCELSHAVIAGDCDAIGGPTSGADPMVVGIGLESLQAGAPLRTFFTRSQAKAHGMQRQIEGPALQPGDRVVLVDDVATSGGSLIKAAAAVRDACEVDLQKALVIVDREEGAAEALREVGIELVALFSRSDFR
ncbi:MAG: orotate phosphoribosyltransferase [Planctomycetota bacterium]